MNNQSITVNLHSFVDIITNSSTVIFTYAAANAEQMVKNLINEILSNVDGSTLTADDLYDIKTVINPDEYEGVVDSLLDDVPEKYEQLVADINELRGEDGYWKHMKEISALLEDRLSFDEIESLLSTSWHDFGVETKIKITPQQNNKRDDLGQLLENLFYHEATRDG